MWTRYEPKNEPAFWGRKAGPSELDGYDPISGLIIAHTEAEKQRLTPPTNGRTEMTTNKPRHPAPEGALPTTWASELADEINNRFEIGLSDAEARKLADLLLRRAVAALK